MKATRRRDEAGAEAANDETLTAALPETSAAIELELQESLAKPRAEVYNNFPELVRRRAPQVEAAAAVQAARRTQLPISHELGRELGPAGVKFAHYWMFGPDGQDDFPDPQEKLDPLEQQVVSALPCMSAMRRWAAR